MCLNCTVDGTGHIVCEVAPCASAPAGFGPASLQAPPGLGNGVVRYSTQPTYGLRWSGLGANQDVYASLSAAQQQAVNTALYGFIIQPGACQGVFPNGATDVASAGIASAADLNDPNNRASAVDCFQQGYNATNSTTLGSGGTGVLDAQTYQALMGSPAPVPPPGPAPAPSTTTSSTGTVIVVGAIAVAAGVLLAYGLTRPKKSSRTTPRTRHA
jgi:hypothetical protein